MPVARLRRCAWVAVTAAAVLWPSLVASDTSRFRDLVPARLLATPDYVYDGQTTYCWGVRANVSSSAITDDLVFVHGTKTECPLTLQVVVENAKSLCTGQSVAVTWRVAAASTAESALFLVQDASPLVDKRTRQRATIIHSNIHTCHFGSNCDAFRQGETDTNATTNQVGNLSATATVAFTTSHVTFTTPGKHVVLAHIIVPGPTLETRYDFAVFTTINVAASRAGADGTSVQGNGNPLVVPTGDNANTTTKATPAHAMSKSQVVVLSAVGMFLFALFVLVAVYSKRHDQPMLCFRKRDDTDLLTAKGSNYCVRGSNLRTRSSDWTELYAIDDMLPVSVRTVDDSNTIAILRDSSRQSTPCSTPTTMTDRTVADFRHDVARWDERASASPITPSSSVILIAAIQDQDLISSTPANDCFVPLESLLMASPPPAVCLRPPSPLSSPPRPRWKKPFRNSSGRKRQRQPRKHAPPEDSGDEQEVDM